MNLAHADDVDIVIIGAGVAGLTALRELTTGSNLRVICLEARDRIGGRVLTVDDPFSPVPIELGAEFIHGRPPETWNLVHAARTPVFQCDENAVHIKAGNVEGEADAWEQVDCITEEMKAAGREQDLSFLSFLNQSKSSDEAKRLATGFVEGFNAARKEEVSVASLAQDAIASEAIDGDRNFRFALGYRTVLEQIASGVPDFNSVLRLNAIIESVDWKPGAGSILIRSGLTGAQSSLRARRIVVTVPLGVLQSGDLRFYPQPEAFFAALGWLRFGNVMRVVLRFHEPWWEGKEELAHAGFWLSQERDFPTWWTTLPMQTTLLTGWSAGPHTDALIGQPRATIIVRALEDLSRVSGFDLDEVSRQLAAAHFHDWHADPFARGAYSYVRAGGYILRSPIAHSVENTLFFAGEATELNGHGGTVHGAIATGKRAANQVLESL